jgi:hypothetical protein
MSETFSKVEVITVVVRRRRFTTEQKLSVVNETTMTMPSMSFGPAPETFDCFAAGARATAKKFLRSPKD